MIRNVSIIVALHAHYPGYTTPPHVHTHRVTTQTDLLSGPFVDSVGRLDLSKAQNSDSGIYRCTGVDVAGGSGYQLFNVEINNVDGKQ